MHTREVRSSQLPHRIGVCVWNFAFVPNEKPIWCELWFLSKVENARTCSCLNNFDWLIEPSCSTLGKTKKSATSRSCRRKTKQSFNSMEIEATTTNEPWAPAWTKCRSELHFFEYIFISIFAFITCAKLVFMRIFKLIIIWQWHLWQLRQHVTFPQRALPATCTSEWALAKAL